MPDYYLSWFLYLRSLPVYYRFVLFGVALIHMAISYSFERFFILGPGVKWLRVFSIRPLKRLYYYLRGRNIRISKKRRLYSKLKEVINERGKPFASTFSEKDRFTQSKGFSTVELV